MESGGWQLFLILLVLAITGTATAYLTKIITAQFGMNGDGFWLWKVPLRLAVLLFGYQVIILIVALVFGQFKFFWNYERIIWKWFGRFFRKTNLSSKENNA